MMAAPRTIEWVGDANGYLRLLDQTRLPAEIIYRDCHTGFDVREAIYHLRVRGAPAIGVAAAYGVVVETKRLDLESRLDYLIWVPRICEELATCRPTAVNLRWALDRMARVSRESIDVHDPSQHRDHLLAEARAIHAEDAAMCQAIGVHGAGLLADGVGVLTHCNAGSLATGGTGTALAVLYAAHEQGKRFRVFADETRPLLQGARLTAWELMQHGIPVTLICDSVAAQVMREGKVQMVVVGADRIAANGDTANKIGTYGVALMAQAHGIPFYVAAPSSTFDLSLPNGDGIPIEQRPAREVTHGFGLATAPEGVEVYNPAFDVTPALLIAGIITDKGVISPVTAENVRRVVGLPAEVDRFSGLAAGSEPVFQT